MTAIFGARAANMALILSGQTEKLNELQEATENAGGTAERMAKQQMAGLVGAFKTAVSRVESLMIALGDAGVTGALISMSKALVKAIDWFLKLSDDSKSLIASLISLGPLLLGISFALKGIGITLALIMSPLNLLIAAIAIGVFAFLNWDRVVRLTSEGIYRFGQWLQNLTGLPVFSWIGKLTNLWRDFLSLFKGQSKQIDLLGNMVYEPAVFEQAINSVKEYFGWIISSWKSVLEWFKGPGKDQSIWEWLWEGIGNRLFGWIGEAWDRTLKMFAAILNNFLQWLNKPISDLFNWSMNSWNQVLDWFKGPGEDKSIWDWLVIGISLTWDWIKNSWNSFLQWIRIKGRPFGAS